MLYKCPSSTEHYAAVKKNEAAVSALTWHDLQNAVSSEK